MTDSGLAGWKQPPDVVSVLLLTLPALVYVLGFVTIYYPFVSWRDGIVFLMPFWLGAAFFWLLLQGFLNNRSKTDLLLLLLSIPFYFFAAWHDRLANWFRGSPAGTYSMHLLLVILFVSVLAGWILRYQKPLHRLRKALLIVFLALPVFECWSIMKVVFEQKTNRRVFSDATDLWPSDLLTLNNEDLYILVVDELASSRSLQQDWGISNESLDSSLQQLGLHVVPEARSPYFFTHFSLAAFFNQHYLSIHDPQHILYADYLQALRAQRESFLLTFLEKQGYEIISFSPFPLKGNSIVAGSSEEPDWLGNLHQQTAYGRIRKDLGWHFPALFNDTSAMHRKLDALYQYQDTVKQLIIHSATDGHKNKRLVYGHLFLSHQPILWDKSGHRRPIARVFGDSTNQMRVQAYAANLPHVNAELQDMVSKLLQARNGNITLLVVGDHGLRLSGTGTENYFRPFCAAYAPHHEQPLPDTINTVNLLRILLSYQQPPPVLPSKMIWLNDRTNFDRSK